MTNIMRELLKTATKERDRVKQFINYKNKANIQELQIARLLRIELDLLGIKWTKSNKESISIYYNANTENSKIEAKKTYFRILDYLYFIKELENNQLVIIQQISYSKDKSDEEVKTLCNRKLYEYNKEENKFLRKDDIKGFPKELVLLVNDTMWSNSTYNIEVIELLDKYVVGGIVYPLPQLNEYVKNGFKSTEQRRHEEQLRKSNLSIIIAAIAIIVSILLPVSVSTCSPPTQLDDIQIILIESKAITPEKTEVFSSDTLEIKYIQK